MLHRFWPLIAATAYAVVFLVASAMAQEATIQQREEVQIVIRDQISAFQAKDHERAFSHADPSIKSIFKGTDQFINMVKGGYAPLYDPQSYSFARARAAGGEVFQEVIAVDKNGKQWQAIYKLKQQPDGSWKISGVTMEPFGGASI